MVAPENQKSFGDIFISYWRLSNPAKVCLLGRDSTGVNTGCLFDPKQLPIAYLSGLLPALSRLDILEKPTDLKLFDGDGDVLAGYGLRSNTAFPQSTNTDLFQEMLANRRISIILLNKQLTNLVFFV